MPRQLKCGCTIEFPIDWENIPLDCPYTWDIFCEGNTKGVFQLETGLGKSWSKKTQPRNLEELSDLISVIRPGVLEAKLDGKSLTAHYAERKTGVSAVEYIHPALEPYLKSTYGILVYQEQVLNIAKGIAGYTLEEADNLRKGIGKKKADIVQAHRISFIEGCEKVGIITKENAEMIFDWIEKSQRYSFNKSHGISYAKTAYRTAYAKAHIPQKFMVACFRSASEKVKPKEEIAELVRDCKNNHIVVSPPQFHHINKDRTDFYLKDDEIFFGLTNIKGVGEAQILKILEKINAEEVNRGIIDTWDWNTILFTLGNESKTVIENSILCGAFDYLGLDRQRMLYELKIFKDLSEKEQAWIESVDGDLQTKLQKMIESFHEYEAADAKTKKIIKDKKSISSNRRLIKIENLLQLLESPPRLLVDSDIVNMNKERELLGVTLTVDILSGYNTSISTCSCSDFNSGFTEDEMIICGKISRVSPYIIKTGKNQGNEMCFVTIEDNTGELDCVIFTKEYLDIKDEMYSSNILGFVGCRSSYKNSFVINRIVKI